MVRRAVGMLATLVAVGLLAACSGSLAAPDGPPLGLQKSEHDVTFDCRAGALAESSMQRLSRTQYENTVHDLLEAQLPSYFDAIWPVVRGAFAALPEDTISKVEPFSTMDQAVSQQHVNTYFNIAQVVAQALTQDDAHVAALLSCRAGEPDGECVARFLQSFGRRAFRHSLSDAELGFLREVYAADGVDAAGLRDVITVALNAPQFLYRVELGDQPLKGRPHTYTLTGAELATRLAYHFWQTMPDDALLASAEAGELASDKAYEKRVEQMHRDPRGEASMRVFVREWLALDGLRDLDALVGDPVFDAFAGSDTPSPELRDDMIDDVLDSFAFHVRRDDSFAEWFTSSYSFARSDELAAIYASEKWDGQNAEPPRFPTGLRSGLLTRAALLSTGSAKTRPIMKGVFVRTRILCDRVPPPPANATTIPAELTTTMTTRKVVETLTEQPGSSCAGCHTTLINPLGFATENYDALGRIRATEVLYSAEGKALGEQPVLTESTPRVWSNDDTSSSGASDLTELILSSGKAEACFARQYIRFAYGRTEDEEIDGCALESVRSALQSGKSLQQALRAAVLRPEFRQRFVGDVQ
ncbi:MAG: Cellulose-binding domain protein [Myxococcaceae bacterium]|nr:Cellulose-binding domain protein [Myxococcaceae bacterium]